MSSREPPRDSQPDADRARSVDPIDVITDAEEAYRYVLDAFPMEIRVRIEQTRAVLKLPRNHAVFLMLALGSEMLQRMEAARDVFGAPFAALHNDVIALNDELAGRLDLAAATRLSDQKLLAEVARRAAETINDAVAKSEIA